MQTTRLISTVSYNTPEYLKGKLYDLVRAGIIEYAHWIWHNPEEDEKKQHAHVVMQPNKRLDTSALRNEFKETVAGEDSPRCVMPFKFSKMNDWLLYAVHDVIYLMRKNQNRKLRYHKGDLITTEPDLLDEDWRAAHEGEDSRMQQVIQLAEKGLSFPEMLKSGMIPPNQLFQYREIWQQFFIPATERNGKEGHEDDKTA